MECNVSSLLPGTLGGQLWHRGSAWPQLKGTLKALEGNTGPGPRRRPLMRLFYFPHVGLYVKKVTAISHHFVVMPHFFPAKGGKGRVEGGARSRGQE